MLARPRASGSLVQSRAQCPVFPQRAHLLFDMILRFDHFLGRAVLRCFWNLLGFFFPFPLLPPLPLLPLFPLPLVLERWVLNLVLVDSDFCFTYPRFSFSL